MAPNSEGPGEVTDGVLVGLSIAVAIVRMGPTHRMGQFKDTMDRKLASGAEGSDARV
jgi:hypothetical protein